MSIAIKKATDIKRAHNWRGILYAPAGLGKTSSILNAEGKILVLSLDNSDRVLAGAKNIDVIEFDRIHPEGEMTEFLKQAPKLVKDYDILVVDNVSSFQSDWFIEKGRKSTNGISNELQHYSQWTNYFLRVLTTLYSLDINVLATAWEDRREFHASSGQLFNQYVPQLRASVLNQTIGLTDFVGHLIVNEKTGTRGVVLEGDNSTYAKNRIDNRKVVAIEELFEFGNTETKK
jgi:phage nucleotide-binding protein